VLRRVLAVSVKKRLSRSFKAVHAMLPLLLLYAAALQLCSAVSYTAEYQVHTPTGELLVVWIDTRRDAVLSVGGYTVSVFDENPPRMPAGSTTTYYYGELSINLVENSTGKPYMKAFRVKCYTSTGSGVSCTLCYDVETRILVFGEVVESSGASYEIYLKTLVAVEAENTTTLATRSELAETTTESAALTQEQVVVESSSSAQLLVAGVAAAVAVLLLVVFTARRCCGALSKLRGFR